MKRTWTIEDINKKIKDGTIPKNQIDLFAPFKSDKIIPGVKKEKLIEGYEIEIMIPAMKSKTGELLNPLWKQSDRTTIAPHGKRLGTKLNNEWYYRTKDLTVIHYQRKEIKEWEKHIAIHARSQLPSDFVMFTKEVHVLSLIFTFKPNPSHSKKVLRAINENKIIYKTTQPDLPDNLSKAIYDGLQGIVYKNDGLICSETNKMKIYGKEPSVYIKLKGR